MMTLLEKLHFSTEIKTVKENRIMNMNKNNSDIDIIIKAFNTVGVKYTKEKYKIYDTPEGTNEWHILLENKHADEAIVPIFTEEGKFKELI